MITVSGKIFRKPEAVIKTLFTKWNNNHKSLDRLNILPALWGLDTGVLVIGTFRFSPNFASAIKQSEKTICSWLQAIFPYSLILTLFRMWWGLARWQLKDPPNSFSSVTSANVAASPKTFWLLVLTLLPHWCKISSSYLVPVPNYSTYTKTTPQKSGFFGQVLIKLRLW